MLLFLDDLLEIAGVVGEPRHVAEELSVRKQGLRSRKYSSSPEAHAREPGEGDITLARRSSRAPIVRFGRDRAARPYAVI